uniref:Uncharacterized protein n=1 Tax=Panagrolaimus sp. PS1159 TaxID=55785 RepID=A0AC35FYI1_9BILA
MWCICFPLKRYNDDFVSPSYRTSIFDDTNPDDHCTKTIYKVVKKAIEEYNRQSANACYYFIAKINRAHTPTVGIWARIEVTIGLTTIKKNKIPQKFVIFPSSFEADKSLREDIVIRYHWPIEYAILPIEKEVTFQQPPHERIRDKNRLKYLSKCILYNCQPDYQYKFLLKNHFCFLCLINHAKIII